MEFDKGLTTVRTLADCLKAIGHPSRFKVAEFCREPRKFTDIIIGLQLNPASFKFHAEVLINCGLIEKASRGIYKTTELGNLVLELVNQARVLSDQNHVSPA